MNRQEQRSEETRNRILEAAESCFAQFGYDGTSVAQICDAAGVSKGALYHHYETKQEIFLELLGRWLQTMDSRLEDMGADIEDVPGKLLSMSSIIGTVLAVPRDQLLIYMEFVNKAVRERQVWEATVEPYHHYQKLISDMIESGIAQGSLRVVEVDSASRAVIALAMGMLIQGLFDPQGTDWEQVANDGFALLLDGLRPR